jgi:hypothetical protein
VIADAAEHWAAASARSSQGRTFVTLRTPFNVRLSHCPPVGIGGGQRVELADLLAEGFEVSFEASDLVDRVVTHISGSSHLSGSSPRRAKPRLSTTIGQAAPRVS